MKTKFLVAIFVIASMCICCKNNDTNLSNDPTKGSSTPELIEKCLGKTANEADKIITNAGWVLVEEEEDYRLFFAAEDKAKGRTEEGIVIDETVKNWLEVILEDGLFVEAHFGSNYEEMPNLRKQTREIVNWAYSNVLKGKSIKDSYIALYYEESTLENLNHNDFVNKLSAEDWCGAIERYDFKEGGGYIIEGVEYRTYSINPNGERELVGLSRMSMYCRSILDSMDWQI